MTVKYAAFLFYALLTVLACGKGPDVEYVGMDKLKIKKINNKGHLVLSTKATLHNGYNTGVDIAKVELAVYLDDKHVSDVLQTQLVKMPPKSDFVLPLEAEVSAKQLFGGIGAVLGAIGENKKMSVQMKGKIYVKVLGREVGLPFRYAEERAAKDFF
jgi:LEA14-like dessication related protein